MGGYTWWPADYLADEHVRAMSYEQEGVYRACLDLAWLHGSIPADLEALARVLGKGMSVKRLGRLWLGIAPCWQADGSGRLVNGRLERERADLVAFRAERSASGRRGNAKRWLSDGSAMAQGSPPTPTPSPTPVGASKSLQHRGASQAPTDGSHGRTKNDELPGLGRRRAEGQGMAHIASILPEAS